MSWFTPFSFSRHNATAAAAIASQLHLLSAVPDTPLNRAALTARVEFFLGAKKSGVTPHTDPQCQWVMSSQFSGEKNWRLAMPVSPRRFLEANRDKYGDELVAADV